MTTLQEDLTIALRRRAEAVTIDDNLDAILEAHDIVRFSHDDGSTQRRSRTLVVAASVAMIVGAGGLIWANGTRSQPRATIPASPGPVDTLPSDPIQATPPDTAVSNPTEFPSDVPRPDTFDLMTLMTTDGEPFGWEFYDQSEPTDSVERCTEYASSFDPSWTSTAKTGEAPSAIYAHIFHNGQWQVGVYCTTDGGYLVQVMAVDANPPLTADTLPAPSADAPLTHSTVEDATVATSGPELDRFDIDAWEAAIADISDSTGWDLINAEYGLVKGSLEFSDGSTHVWIETGPPEWRAVVVDPDVAGEPIPEGTMYFIDATATGAARVLIVVAPDDVVTADFSPVNSNVEDVIDATRRVARVSIAIRDHTNSQFDPN